MAEDRGAFKTNPAKSRQILAIRSDPTSPLQASLTRARNVLLQGRAGMFPPICNEHPLNVAVFLN
jgi:hypothetical protein